MGWSSVPQRHGRPLALPSTPRGVRVGIEHEYRLWSGDGSQVDFRILLPNLTPRLRALDPGDPRVRRLPSGVAITADGMEAELATPPFRVDEQDVATSLDSLLSMERTNLWTAVSGHQVERLTGFSTHVNISVSDERLLGVADRFARTCGLAIFALAEPCTSQGLLVRPRRGRLEIGSEYVEGERLRALVTFVVATVHSLGADEPPPVAVTPDIEPAREKFGWFLPPTGPANDLLRHGRIHPWQGVVEDVWAWARPACVELGLDPSPVDRLVAGPWRMELDHPLGRCTVDEPAPPLEPPAVSTGPRELAGGGTAQTEWLTWDSVVWRFDAGRCRFYAVLSAQQESEFLRRLDAGVYESVIRRMTHHPRWRRQERLMVHAQIQGAAWWGDVRPGALVPAERLPNGEVPRVSHRRAARAHRRALRPPDPL